MHAYRSHKCSELRPCHVGQTVRLSGWVHRIRDHGGVLFIDLRDHYGVTQVLADPDSGAFGELESVRSEWVIRVDGEVKLRDRELVNSKIPTGEIEVFIRELEVLGKSLELPLPVFGDQEYPEETRLKYRYIDLRRESVHRNIMLRSKVVASLRSRMHATGFTEFQTPILTASSPEGARDFLVPSRLHPGKFYALPQAPQQYKQLVMMAGFDKYFQIAPCFRDEDPRADRSPGEFYQLDMEMSFATQEDVFQVIEPVMKGLFSEFGGGKPVTGEFPRIRFRDSMMWYGTDKPDLRNPLKMQVVSEHFKGSGFRIFASLLENEGNEIRAIPAPGGGSRAFCDRMNSFAQREGLPGMGYIFWRDAGGEAVGAGPLAKNIGPQRTNAIRRQLNLDAGDAAFFLGGRPSAFEDVAAKARDEIGNELNLTNRNRFEFCWITDFPMYEKDEETGRLGFSHNPFSMPQGGMAALEGSEPLEILGFQYDIVCNGVELSSGAVRNHDPEIMYKAFELAGHDRQFVDANFGGMVNALKFGAPPHAGIAPGIDRIVMLIAGVDNIREVTMFPLNQRAEELMLGAPSEPTNEALRDLGIRVVDVAP
ncbi:MAG: aspartate--tRNA ligase [Albidovulum sp.]|nr:aspartate--tRNA ligase [Albidovulum sp.]MDE0530772.1 aspartate--tRNA ligase [Albidovulum sp.]